MGGAPARRGSSPARALRKKIERGRIPEKPGFRHHQRLGQGLQIGCPAGCPRPPAMLPGRDHGNPRPKVSASNFSIRWIIPQTIPAGVQGASSFSSFDQLHHAPITADQTAPGNRGCHAGRLRCFRRQLRRLHAFRQQADDLDSPAAGSPAGGCGCLTGWRRRRCRSTPAKSITGAAGRGNSANRQSRAARRADAVRRKSARLPASRAWLPAA